MLQALLGRIVQADALKLFRDKLRERLEGGRGADLLEARAQLDKALRVKARLLQMMDNLGISDEDLADKFQQSCSQCLLAQRRVAELEVAVQQTDIDSIHAQLVANVDGVIEQFLLPQSEPYRANAILKSVFPLLRLLYKPDRYTAIFEVHTVPGAVVACATNTQLLVGEHQVLHLCLVTSGSRYPTWSVHELGQPDIANLYDALGRPMPDA